MSDLISRQDVKEWLERWEGYLDKDMISRMQLKVDDIPTHSTPSNTLGALDCVDGQKAIDAWKEDFKGFVNSLDMLRDDYKGIMEYIDELPSAQPDVPDTNVGELISKQDAIETALIFFIEYFGGAFREDDQLMLKKRMEELPSVQPQWIPCSKRLPSDSDYYLVTDAYGDESVIWFAHEKDYYGKSEWRETEDEILAWMPLPECYRGDSDDNH